VLDRLAHVARPLGAGLGDGVRHQRGELVVGELGGQVRLDRRGLLGLAVGEVVAAVLAVDALGLAAALALAAEHGDLIARALLRVLLELGEHQPQRRSPVAIPGLHGRVDVRSDSFGNLHVLQGYEAKRARPRKAPRNLGAGSGARCGTGSRSLGGG
jgi:hypothetical protein